MGLDSLAASQVARLKAGNATFHVPCRLIDCRRKVGVPVRPFNGMTASGALRICARRQTLDCHRC
eukprot:604127-Pyramimonas_sp.AAC.1